MTIRTQPVTSSLLGDAFAHHAWATGILLDACAELTPEQLATTAPGTYGSIAETLHHLVESDRWYLRFFRLADQPPTIDEQPLLSLAELRSEIAISSAAWAEVLGEHTVAEEDLTEHGDGWEHHAPASFRLAQVVHHGTDHRSQVCTILSTLGLTPPEIDVWAYGEATSRSRAVRLAPS